MLFGNGNGNNDLVAEKLKQEIVGWLKGIRFRQTEKRCRAGVTHKYQCFGLGWSRRIAASVDLVNGVKRNKKWYDQNIKKPY